eukprot:TRINITY_DN2160_c1_g1_i2.p1 TRINITY_DN2160_c1_g1~~TRINITY_DN2160_c1_g1_i2.p1  ORF type:complete len:351 (+),score=40.82 TRINITY_DN2160_c1_g1_i2:60-1112(+)
MSCLRAARTNETKVIDKLLKEERKQRKCKVLVLGAGDSGKSTFIKQLCLINYSRTSTEYQQLVTDTRVGIYSSIREGMRFLIDYTENCGLKIEDPELCEAILLVKNASYVDMKDQELLSAIKMLWSSETIKKICGTISSSIPCNLVYMLDHLDQYQQEGYEIQDDDILRVRIKTTGVHHYTINDVKNPPPWCFIDVGGQKSERRKWVHAFDDVVAVVYVSALDSFERTLEESSGHNRLDDDLELFKQVISSPFLPNHWIFFQNKADIFEQKVASGDFSKRFPELGDVATDFNQSVQWHRQKFREQIPGGDGAKVVTFHVTCALDREKMYKIMSSVQNKILQDALTTIGMC